MPIYEYMCQECLSEFEELVYDDKKIICNCCGSDNIEKKLSVFSSRTVNSSAEPSCATGCGRGFEGGCCGGGTCHGH